MLQVHTHISPTKQPPKLTEFSANGYSPYSIYWWAYIVTIKFKFCRRYLNWAIAHSFRRKEEGNSGRRRIGPLKKNYSEQVQEVYANTKCALGIYSAKVWHFQSGVVLYKQRIVKQETSIDRKSKQYFDNVEFRGSKIC